MSTVSSVELAENARLLAGGRFDDYATRALCRAYDEYVGRRRRSVGPVSLTANGRSYPSVYAIIAERDLTASTLEVRMDRPAGPAEFEFLIPFERIEFRDDGYANLHAPDGGQPRPAIARLLLREHYVVRSRAEDQTPTAGPAAARMPSLVGTVQQGITICRAASVVPFEVALLLYLAEERARFEVDLVHGTLLADPRAGRLAASRRVRRASRLSWSLDRKLGRGHLSLLAARCLEVLVESNGLTSIDLSHIFGGVREMVESALQALVQQRFATFDPRTGVYRPRLEAFVAPATPAGPSAPAPVRPELRTGVQELIAAADARATCPLCGRPLPRGPSTLLCDDCAQKVGID